MTNQEYKTRKFLLQKVLDDAVERGDYHQEYATIAMLEQLEIDYRELYAGGTGASNILC